MPAYDFEEAFKDDKKSESVSVQHPQQSVTSEKIANLSVDEKKSFLTKTSTISNQSKSISLLKNKLGQGKFYNIDEPSSAAVSEEDKQKELRTVLLGEFLKYIKPDIDKNLSFKFSRVDFKGFLVIPALITILVSLFMTGGILLLATLLFPAFLYLQTSESAQMRFFERGIWKSIDAIPEDKLQTILHSILSNELVEDLYDEEEIKEIIFNYMYSGDKHAKTNAQHKIRENLRAIVKASKNILHHQKIGNQFASLHSNK